MNGMGLNPHTKLTIPTVDFSIVSHSQEQTMHDIRTAIVNLTLIMTHSKDSNQSYWQSLAHLSASCMQGKPSICCGTVSRIQHMADSL